jgi:hypothetical protein
MNEANQRISFISFHSPSNNLKQSALLCLVLLAVAVDKQAQCVLVASRCAVVD